MECCLTVSLETKKKFYKIIGCGCYESELDNLGIVSSDRTMMLVSDSDGMNRVVQHLELGAETYKEKYKRIKLKSLKECGYINVRIGNDLYNVERFIKALRVLGNRNITLKNMRSTKKGMESILFITNEKGETILLAPMVGGSGEEKNLKDICLSGT